MAVLIPASGFRQDLEEFAKQLSHLSDVVEVGDDNGTNMRRTSFAVVVPDSASGVTTVFDYREEFARTREGWLRTAYYFEFRRQKSDHLHSRRAHHEHEPFGIHQHCETTLRADAHYADVERLKQATHEVFLNAFAKGSPIECYGLLPLRRRAVGAG